jgi:hypothetical protein
MLFGKKIKKDKNKQPEKKESNVVVHTLPAKLLKKKSGVSGGSNKGNPLNFLIFFVIFLLVGGGSFFIFKDYIFPDGLPFLSQPSNENINNSNTNEEPVGLPNTNSYNDNTNNSNENSNENDNTNTLSNVNVTPKRNNRNTNDNTNSNENDNTNTKVDPLNQYLQTIPPAPDRDRDTMPDIEEALYGTKPGISDTDRDGFLDGQELAHAYNPLEKNSDKIIESGLVKVYNNPTYRYSVLYPASWKVVPLGGSDQEMTFVSDNKEFIEVAIMDNPDALTAIDWYLNQIPAELAGKAERIWANNFMGIKSLDGLNFYLTPNSGDKNFIYQISYMAGSHTHISFPITFQMMIRTFDLHK